MKFSYTWQISAFPSDEVMVHRQICEAIEKGEMMQCSCESMSVVVFGHREKEAFSAFVNCQCGKIRNPRFVGVLKA